MKSYRLAAATMLISGIGFAASPSFAIGQGDRGQAMGLPLQGYLFEVAGHCARHSPQGEVEQMRRLADAQPDAREFLLRQLRKGLRRPKSAEWCQAEMKGIR